jgi:hypothetical protein
MKKSIFVLLIAILVAVCAIAGGLLYKNSLTIRGLTADLAETQAALAQAKTELDDTNNRLAETLATLEDSQRRIAELEEQLSISAAQADDEEGNVTTEVDPSTIFGGEVDENGNQIGDESQQAEDLPGEPVSQPEVSQPEVSEPEPEVSQPAPSQPAPSQPSAGSTELNPPLDSLPKAPLPSLGGGGGDSGQNGTITPDTGDYSGPGLGFDW